MTIAKLIDPTDPTRSMKHAAYGVGVVASIGWLSYDLVRRPMSSEWVAAFIAFLAAVVTGKVIKSGAAAPTPQGRVVSASGSPLGSASEEASNG